ncbi:GNAT family N-acetyltransferase [Allorhizocola rhizosphaerae]|uniref:GNAT family N-acetyltransferase n=1 Tax=Allorhizocola rhizosphaerae TaxID=1872709 RepID=UPI000E3D2BD8|nr:GNAT family protein [Allorhizocola rhizosphaerae]
MLALTLDAGAHLRDLEPWHADEFAAHVDRIRDHLKPWIPFASRIYDADGARDLLQRFADKRAADTGRFYGLWLDGELSGGTLFKEFDTASGVCEVGVWLAPWATGRGLITRAVTSMIDWAVGERGMHRIEWRTDPRNERSRAAAARLGMTREGVLRSSFVIGDTRFDTEVWAILADEWRGQRTRATMASATASGA